MGKDQVVLRPATSKQIVQVATQQVHGVAEHGIAIPYKREQGVELWSPYIFAKGFVEKGCVRAPRSSCHGSFSSMKSSFTRVQDDSYYRVQSWYEVLARVCRDLLTSWECLTTRS